MSADDQKAAGPAAPPWDFDPLPDTAVVGEGGSAVCLGFALRNEARSPTAHFFQAETAVVSAAFRFERDAEVAWLTAELHDTDGCLVTAAEGFGDAAVAREVSRGDVAAFELELDLELGPGSYTLTLELSSTTAATFTSYHQTPPNDQRAWPLVPPDFMVEAYFPADLTYEELAATTVRLVSVSQVATLTIGFDKRGRLPSRGVARIPFRARRLSTTNGYEGPTDGAPTIAHVTHPKAGSQWIRTILEAAAPGRTVSPGYRPGHFRLRPPEPGLVYPGLMFDRATFLTAFDHLDVKRFVVVRDIRDVIVSAYFSIGRSHQITEASLATQRAVFGAAEIEGGLLRIAGGWASAIAQVQLSWLDGGETLVRYEDLLDDDVGVLQRVLIDECGLPIERDRLEQIVLERRFEAVKKARPEDAHQRQGRAGDWQNYFTPRVTQAVKARYGGLLVATGYEADIDW